MWLFGEKDVSLHVVTNNEESMKRLYIIIGVVAALLFMTSCSERKPRYVIGVSQCSQDIWRDKLNQELMMGTYFHDDVELKMTCADDNDERQIAQIDSMVAAGVDLIIVAPNQAIKLTPAIDRAFDMGIPVIVFDRKTDSQKFTAYIGADSEDMGRQMGEYIATQLGGQGRVLEIMGLKGSSPAIERHHGFVDALSHYPDIELVASLQGDWTEQSAVDAVTAWLDSVATTTDSVQPIDFVFGQNDRMAVGARKAMQGNHTSQFSPLSSHLPRFCGIDGLPGKGGGLELVRDSVLDASYIYPTRGDDVLQLAVDILSGKPYEKDNRLMSALVTHDNAKVLLMLNEETQRRSTYLNSLKEKSNDYLQQLGTQRLISYMAIGGIVLLLIIVFLFWLYRRGKTLMRRERVVSNLWNMETPQPAPVEPTGEKNVVEEVEDKPDAPFIAAFKEVVERRLADSNLSVEDLAADMNLSRVQLYRKVKTSTGSTPNELLRSARLNRGYQLLLTIDKTVSEVAYAVGFTAPSYFTKCFKDEFGQSPTELKVNG